MNSIKPSDLDLLLEEKFEEDEAIEGASLLRLSGDLKTADFIKTMAKFGFKPGRGGKEGRLFTDSGLSISVPRHTVIKNTLVRKELRRLGIPEEDFVAKLKGLKEFKKI